MRVVRSAGKIIGEGETHAAGKLKRDEVRKEIDEKEKTKECQHRE